jgi:uncharacterized protein YndB with AHSA1/START domain
MNHEYSVLGGINRARIGQIIGALAAAISSALVALLLAALNLAKALGFDDYVPAVLLPPIGAGVVFTVLYWFFDRHAWKLPFVKTALGVPDLGGVWTVEGQTLNPDKSSSYAWRGEITTIQTWDRIRVRLKTAQSGSNSITAALVRDEADGVRLFYSYRNDPRVDQPELNTHRGWAEITFSHDLTKGEGEYFNGLGRFTFGTMTLTKEG